MIKEMKLSTKIATGFSVLILIMIALGGMAVWNMGSVKTESVKLADEFVPEVTVANEIERDSLATMYNIRGYTMSLEKSYLELGQKSLVGVQENLKKAEELATKAVHLTALKGQVDKAKEGVKAYEQLLNESVQNIDEINDVRGKLNSAAADFAATTKDFYKGQSDTLRKEINEHLSPDKLAESHLKMDLMNQVIDTGWSVRLAVWKAQALNDSKQLDKVESNFEEMTKNLAEIRRVTTLESMMKDLDKIKSSADSYHAGIKEYLRVTAKQAEINKARGEAADNVLAAARATSQKGIEHTSEIATGAAAALNASLWALIVGLLVATGIGIALAFFITLSISRPLKKAIDSMKNSTSQIGAASAELSSASQQLSSGANEQASAIEETSASLEEMAGMVQNNVTNAQKAKDLSTQVKTLSEQGNDSMGKLQGSMKEILQSNAEIEQLVKVIGEIGEKTKVMDEIVFQTKLLSFNASVEAERAGEHGRGFAVVAQEVGNLAQMSGKSAQEIAQIVTSSIRQAEAITTENKKKVEIGNAFVVETGKFLKEIMGSATTVTEGAQQVVSASSEQAAGIKQINLAMSNLDKATQQNASMAEETASTSEELSVQTTALNDLVGDLVRLVDGAGATTGGEHTQQVKTVTHRPPLKLARSETKGVKPTTARPVSLKKAVGSDYSPEAGAGDDWDKI